ncbi:MAG: multiheme c-type cytochrome [Nitrospirota bacterium]
MAFKPFVFTLFLLFTLVSSSGLAVEEDMYAGSNSCKACHEKEYVAWKESGHARILHKSDSAEIGGLPLPAGFSQREISYVIGGFKWKALYLDKNGYLITSTKAGEGKNQYNMKNRRWVHYRSGQKIAYDCGRCHTTGFSAEGHQNGLEGIIGRWKFEGVQCEVCHGPGGKHVRTSQKGDVSVDKDICMRCHGTEPLSEIPLNVVFLAQYTEANQLLKSSMRGLLCTVCHDPHFSSEKSVRQTCESCHQKEAGEYRDSYMHKLGVTCVDCHMPPAVMIAEGRVKIYEGDFKTHLFRIEHHRDFPVLEKQGKKVNPGYLSVDYACMRCHYINHDRKWAARFGMFAHTIKASSGINRLLPK